MSDIAFNPVMSTNEIFRANNRSQFLTNDLDAIEEDIQALETGKADANHTHTGYAAANHTHTGYAPVNHTHSDYAAKNHTHSGYAAASHNHNSAYIAKALQIIADDGDVQYTYSKADNPDLLVKIAAMSIGMHTAYSQSGVTNNPKTIEAWRMLIHKTSATSIWVLAFGSSGSIFSNFKDSNGWKGWKAIYDVGSPVLWSGKLYPNANHTITPSKKLTECRNGWMLLWCDYDPDTGTANDADIATTMIPKCRYDGNPWDGKNFLCDVPRFYGSATDTSLEKRITKTLAIYDNKIVGNAVNSQGDRNDVVLRAVYEF